MKKNKHTSSSMIKIAIIAVFLIVLCGAGRVVLGNQVHNVEIILSDNVKLNVVTNKTKVSEILTDNHIVVLPEENVYPSLDTEIEKNGQIIITKDDKVGAEAIASVEEIEEITMDDMLEKYAPITEKIVVEEVTIPFETVTKDISNEADETKERVLQQGKDGLKEVTYRVKYKNDVEISREVISEEIIEEPVDKIIQVQNAVVASRTVTSTRTTTTGTPVSAGATYKVTAYCSCAKCCGKTNGITASGTKATANHTVAAPSSFAMGTKLLINGTVYTVEDRGGAITGNKIDVYMNSHAEALAWGVKYLTVQVVE